MSSRLGSVLSLALVVFAAALALLSAADYVSLVFAFELMLFSALGLLRVTSKTERSTEALLEMYTWAILGSFFLILSLIILGNFQLSTLIAPLALGASSCSSGVGFLFALLGFAVKVPLWPFSSWLLKAHVEASTEFSVFLSGFLVKFGVIAMWRVLVAYEGGFVLPAVMAISLIGICDAICRLVVQVDLKRIVALTTVIETSWLALCLSINSNALVGVGVCLVFVHCVTTTLEFYAVDFLYRRFGSRSILVIGGVGLSDPVSVVVLWAIVLITIGLPGTSIFSMK